jgi:hypothetical protein
MVFMSKILERVVHVLGSINFKEFSLSICDCESISLRVVLVFSEISANNRTISSSIIGSEHGLIKESTTEDGESLPTEGHTFEARYSKNSLNTQP